MNRPRGSLFVGYFTAENFVEHIHEFEKSVKLDPSMLLYLRVDGDIVNIGYCDIVNIYLLKIG